MSSPRPDKIVVVAVCGLPPGGGKSTFFECLCRMARGAGYRMSTPSSDFCRRHHINFDHEVRMAMHESPPAHEYSVSQGERDESTHDLTMPISNVRIVGYDKNVPNIEGLRKLCRVLESVEHSRRRTIEVLLISPETIDDAVCWRRIRQRDPSHLGLTTADGVETAQHVYQNFFLRPSRAFLPQLSRNPWKKVAIRSEAFWTCTQDLETLCGSVLTLLGAEDGGHRGSHGTKVGPVSLTRLSAWAKDSRNDRRTQSAHGHDRSIAHSRGSQYRHQNADKQDSNGFGHHRPHRFRDGGYDYRQPVATRGVTSTHPNYPENEQAQMLFGAHRNPVSDPNFQPLRGFHDTRPFTEPYYGVRIDAVPNTIQPPGTYQNTYQGPTGYYTNATPPVAYVPQWQRRN